VLAQPALLAQHFSAAGLAGQAVPYWLKAGQQALARSAMAEAVAQLRKGLDTLADMPDGPARRQYELDLQTTLGSALSATEGYSAADVDETLSRARALAPQLDRPEYLVSLHMGQWAFHCVRAEHRLALAQGEQLEQIGDSLNDGTTQLLGRLTHGGTCLFLGEFVTSRAVMERPIGVVDPARRPASMLDWLTGSPMVYTQEFLALTAEHGFPSYRVWALAFHGRWLITLGQPQKGIELITQGLAELRASGGVLLMQVLFTWLAEAYALLGQSAEVRNYLAEAARIVETTDERVFEAELSHRVPGNLLHATGERSAAEQYYRQAIAVAERQSARLLQLKASTSLARLRRDQGKRAEARDLLVPIYTWFTEGFDASDLKNAKALLDELA